MPARSTLRDRRRLQTAREIQSAALRLALQNGYEAVTTEMISDESGISQRTFFNYYANKEAAIVGRSPEIAEQIIEDFRHSSRRLMEALFDALDQHLRDSQINRETVRMIDTLLERSPELVPRFYASLQKLTDQMVELIRLHHPEDTDRDAELLAELISHSLANAIRNWAQSKASTESDIARNARSQIERIGALIRSLPADNA